MAATAIRRPKGSRPTDTRLSRLNIEIYPEHEATVTRVKMLAVCRGITFSAAVMEALQHWVHEGGLPK
jgi:hypothetical protein